MRDKSKRAGAKSLTAFDWISVSPGWNVRCKGGRCSCIDSASGLRDNNTHSLANRLTLSPEESWGELRWGVGDVKQATSATETPRPDPARPCSLSRSIALLLHDKLGFYHIPNPDSKTAFQWNPSFFVFFFSVFFFHLFLCSFFGQEHKQIYTTGVFCLCLNVVKSVSQK